MGEVFAGRYELIDMIGEGGMGAVWRVRDLKRDRIIAAKVLRQSDAGALLRFMREQGMRIHHPNVVTPLGWAGEDDKVLFTMPIVEGGSVSELMKEYGALPPRFAAELTRQMLVALAAVHDAGVVHRDIKPANLLLDDTGTARPHLWLTDFGVALAVDAPRLTSLSVVMGTPGYLAPEQLRGADPDPRSDLYAAGMVGLQLLTGHRPRPQMRSERLDLPPRPVDVPEPLWDLMVRLADPDPDGRPQTAHDALRQLSAAGADWVEQSDVVVRKQMPDLVGVGEGEFLRPGESDHTSGGTLTNTQPAAFAGVPTRQQHVPGGAATAAYRPANDVATRADSRLGGAQAVGGPRPAKKSRAPLAVLIGAPLLALAVIAGAFLGPWSSSAEGDGEKTQSPGKSIMGGTCSFRDVGTYEPDGDGVPLQCLAQDNGTYTWGKP